MSLLESDTPLCRRYDVALLDLDGVVYIGTAPVPAAPAALAAARQQGMKLAFVTNNAARPASAVAGMLAGMGVPAVADDVITSAQAAAHYLADRLPEGARVLVVGTTGLIEALHERGLTPVTSADDEPVAVVQGFSPELNWALLSEGAVAIRRGAVWVATNTDRTIPSARGPLPGNGSLVQALSFATGVTPVSTGKPDPTMHRETVERSGARTPLVVGDRLDTDIQGARAVGCASLLVLSGVTGAVDLLRAVPEHRPDFLARDVGGLLLDQPAVAVQEKVAACGRWRVGTSGGALTLRTGTPDAAADRPEPPDPGLDALRALAVAAWACAGGSGFEGPVSAADDAAGATLADLGLGDLR